MTFKPGHRLIVKFKPAGGETLRELCQQVAQLTEGTLARQPSATGRALFDLPSSANVDHLIELIQRLPSVEYVEPDTVDRAQE
jgi:hypothetical protein